MGKQIRAEEDVVDGTVVPANINLTKDFVFQKITTGDLELKSKDGSAHWVIREMPDRVLFINVITNTRYRLVLEEDPP